MKQNISILQFIKEERWNILVLLLISLGAYGTLIFNWVILADEWARANAPLSQFNTAIAVGRWALALIWRISADNLFAPSCNSLVAFSIIIISSLFIAVQLGATRPAEKVLFSSLLFINPILTTHFLFSSHHIPIAIGFLTSALFLIVTKRLVELTRETPKTSNVYVYVLVGSLLLCFVTGIRQSFFLLNTVLLIAVLIEEALSQPKNPRNVAHPTIYLLLTAALGFILWFAIWRLAQKFFQVTDGTLHPAYQFSSSLVSSLSELQAAFLSVIHYFVQYLTQPQPLWPISVKMVFLMLLITYLSGIMVRIKTERENRCRLIWQIVPLLLLMFLAPWAIGMIRTQDTSFRYTALLGLAPIYPIMFLGALSAHRGKKASTIIVGITAIMALLLIQQQSAGVFTVKLSNEREVHTLNRMINRIEAHPNFSKIKQPYRLNLIGTQSPSTENDSLFWIPSGPAMSLGPATMNLYNRWLPWKLNFLMKREQGPMIRQWNKHQFRNFKKNTTEEIYQQTLTEIRDSAPWPSANSVKIIGDQVFLVLSKEKWLQNMILRQLK